jgi:hypothetical protein
MRGCKTHCVISPVITNCLLKSPPFFHNSVRTLSYHSLKQGNGLRSCKVFCLTRTHLLPHSVSQSKFPSSHLSQRHAELWVPLHSCTYNLHLHCVRQKHLLQTSDCAAQRTSMGISRTLTENSNTLARAVELLQREHYKKLHDWVS